MHASHTSQVQFLVHEWLAALLQRGYEGIWLGGTFSKAVFLGNGLIAIVAGLLGHALVEIFKLGPVSPFDAAALVLIGGGVYIAITWTENYGDSADKASFHTSLVNAGKTIWEGEMLETACIKPVASTALPTCWQPSSVEFKLLLGMHA